MLSTAAGRTSKDFGLGGFELQPIDAHPRRHFIVTDGHPEGLAGNVVRPTESV